MRKIRRIAANIAKLPAYHELMRLIYETQAHSFAWTHRDERGAHVARAALSYMWNQGENGICCPMGMAFASIPALQHDKGLYDEWAPPPTITWLGSVQRS